MAYCLQTIGLDKVYAGNGLPVQALSGVDLAITPGEFVALVGLVGGRDGGNAPDVSAL